YAASSGCFWRRCTFCPEKSEQNPYRQIPPARVVTDLQQLVSTTRPVLIHLLDNAISPATLQALATNPPGRPWYGFARIDWTLADPAFCRQLRAGGCAMLKLGLESGDQQLLDQLDKGIDLDLAARVLASLAGAGIKSYVYLLFGTPGESRAEAERTQAFVKAHAERITFLNLAIFNLPINSPEQTGLVIEDFYEGDLAIYRNFVHPRGWNRREVRRFLDESFKREPDIATILARDPPFFTSNHAAFFDHSPVR
ncbi:MAG: radical SAM protein, partial [Desulforhopalus sp.]|nr:radical SAM protein [Desulforhopalus sp.]